MTLQSGSYITLKIGNGGTPETFTTVGGLRRADFVLSAPPVDATRVSSQGWRNVLDGAGTRSVTVSGEGFFSDSAAERTVRDAALAMTIRNYKLEFGNGSVMTGAFRIRSYGRYGKFREEENYRMTFESSGAITFTDPA